MRILYYATEYYCNYGARTHAREFYHALKTCPNVDSIVVFPAEDYLNDLAFTETKERRFLKSFIKRILPQNSISLARIFKPNFNNYLKLKILIEEQRIDCALMRIGNDFKYIGYLKKDFPTLRIIVEMNATMFVEATWEIPFIDSWRRYEASYLGKSDAIMTVSSYWKNYLLEYGISKKNIYVNQNGVNESIFRLNDAKEKKESRRKFGIPENSIVIGYIGGMEIFRRLPEVINMLADLMRQDKNDYFLFIAGTGADIEKVQANIRMNYEILNGRILCPGTWYPYEEIPAIMSSFDVAIFPFSNPYVSPLKIFEYLAMGIPTIGPDIPSVREILYDRKHLLLAKQDGSNFISLIKELTHDEKLKRHISNNGRTHIINNFTWRHNADRVMSVIESLK